MDRAQANFPIFPNRLNSWNFLLLGSSDLFSYGIPFKDGESVTIEIVDGKLIVEKEALRALFLFFDFFGSRVEAL